MYVNYLFLSNRYQIQVLGLTAWVLGSLLTL